MPLLAAWFGALFGSLATFFAEYLTKRLAITAAVIAAAVVITAGFIGAVETLIAGIQYIAPPELTIAWGWLVPDNTDDCIGAAIAGNVVRWGYDWNIKVIQWKLV